jgi:hypothetical protein
MFNYRAYVLASRVSFQNPRVCSLAVLLFNISAPAHLPRFCSKFARMFLVALLFHIRAYVLTCRASV